MWRGPGCPIRRNSASLSPPCVGHGRRCRDRGDPPVPRPTHGGRRQRSRPLRRKRRLALSTVGRYQSARIRSHKGQSSSPASVIAFLIASVRSLRDAKSVCSSPAVNLALPIRYANEGSSNVVQTISECNSHLSRAPASTAMLLASASCASCNSISLFVSPIQLPAFRDGIDFRMSRTSGSVPRASNLQVYYGHTLLEHPRDRELFDLPPKPDSIPNTARYRLLTP